MKTKKLVSWVEIPASNFERAVKFYNNILHLELQVVDCGEEKMACFPTGEGAISYAKDFNPSKDGTLVSLNCEDQLDATLQRIEENGGMITQGKTQIEADNMGYFALFIDCEGNRVGLHGSK